MRNFSLKRLFTVILIGEIFFMAVIVFFLQKSILLIRKRNYMEKQHFAMHQMMTELRHNIDDMTKYSQLYVSTGEKIYYNFYQNLMNSQNDILPKSASKNTIYWKYLNNDKFSKDLNKKKISFIDSIEYLDFSDEEKIIIRSIWKNVELISKVDIEAINAADGSFKDEKGDYTIQKNPDLDYASEILHTAYYRGLKQDSLRSIGALVSKLHKRVSSEIDTQTSNLELQGNVFKILLGIFILSNISGFLILKKRVVGVIYNIINQIKNYENGEFQIDCRHLGENDELGILVKEFNRLHFIINKRTQILEESYEKIMNLHNVIDRYIIISETDINGNIIYVSDAFCEISGYKREELIGKNHRIVRHQDMPVEIFKSMWETITSGNKWNGYIKNRKKGGGFYWVEAFLEPIVNRYGEISGYRSIRMDITDKKRIEKISITDKLTGLNNRSKIDEVFQYEIFRAQRYNKNFSIVLLDIDKFKNVNDVYGHLAGDSVLQEFSDIFKNNTRIVDIVGRWGGEEFLIISPESNLQKATDAAEKLRKIIEQNEFPEAQKVTASFGVSSFIKGDTMDSMIERADRGLYQAKNSGRNKTVAIET